MVKPLFLSAAAVALVAAPSAALAQAKRPSDADLKAAIQTLNIMVSAMNDKKAPPALRDAMFGCLYEHPLSDISARVTKTLAASPKAKANDPNTRLMATAVVCGLPVQSKPKAK